MLSVSYSFPATEYVWWVRWLKIMLTHLKKLVWVFTAEIPSFLHIVALWGGESTEKVSELLWKVA